MALNLNSGIPGDATGATPTASFVGEFYTDNWNNVHGSPTTGLGVTGRTLTAGVWLIICNPGLGFSGGGSHSVTNVVHALNINGVNTATPGYDQSRFDGVINDTITFANQPMGLPPMCAVAKSNSSIGVTVTLTIGTQTANVAYFGSITYVRIK